MHSQTDSPSEHCDDLLDRLFCGDCGEVLAGFPTAFVDLIYIDPPFYSRKRHQQVDRARTTAYSFNDRWPSREMYTSFLRERLQQCKRVLKPTGSIFFHCDRRANHIARNLLDETFGDENFQAEIIWTYRRWSNKRKGLLPSHQMILYYSHGREFQFHQLYTAYSPATNVEQILQQRAKDPYGKSVYRRTNAGDVISNGRKQGVPLSDVWEIPYLNPKARERAGYPTQKPVMLIERIIQMSTLPDQVVLDPFCGSGTTLVAASLQGRRFVGIDIAQDAIALSQKRLARPTKSDSMLMKKSRQSYVRSDESIVGLLDGCDYVAVQRNLGIDAIVNSPTSDAIGLVRIQRFDETLTQAAEALRKASAGKNAALLIVVKTLPDVDIVDEKIDGGIIVVDAAGVAIDSALRALALNQFPVQF